MAEPMSIGAAGAKKFVTMSLPKLRCVLFTVRKSEICTYNELLLFQLSMDNSLSVLSVLTETLLCQCLVSVLPKQLSSVHSAAALSVHTGLSAEPTGIFLAADAAQAGSRSARLKPAIHDLDQDVLDRVCTKLEPDALARAGLR